MFQTCSRYNFSFPFYSNKKPLELTVRYTSIFTNRLFQAPMSLRVNFEAGGNLLARRLEGYRKARVFQNSLSIHFLVENTRTDSMFYTISNSP